MAKRKSKKFNLPKIATLAVVLLAVAGIGLTVLASQQQTRTESEAANCYRAPTIIQTGQKIASNGTTYYFDVVNNCPGYNQFKLRVKETPSAPAGAAWGWNLNSCGFKVNDGCHIEGVHGKKQISLYVFKPNWVKPGNTYQKFTIRAALRSNDRYYDERSVGFYVPLR
jgi:hypothetical protein